MVNIAEGRHQPTIDALAAAAGSSLLDLHVDADHHRSVFTLAGPDMDRFLEALARRTVELVDLRDHKGAHPRLGSLDLVPFAPLGKTSLDQAIEARNRFAAWASSELGLPCFLYGPERSLPDIRRNAFGQLEPDLGPSAPHVSAGALCVGARPPLVAYNLWLAGGDIRQARQIAATLRGPQLRALAMQLGNHSVQVSCNLLDPSGLGPAQVYDAVATLAPVARAELVGLIPAAVLEDIPQERWAQLDLAPGRTLEARLERLG